MERPIHSQLSQKTLDRMQKIHQSYSDAGSVPAEISSEVIECIKPKDLNDSGYSSDVEAFESPMSPMKSIDYSMSLEEYKMQVDEAIREYFASKNVMDCIQELDSPLYIYELVMRAISLSIDRDDKERELISRFLAVASGIIISEFSVTKGFEKLFTRIPDLILDCPSVKDYLSRFLARAIADEVVPPAIINDLILRDHGDDVLRNAEDLLNVPHGLELLEHVWGAGSASLDELQIMKELVRDAILEYYDCHDISECLHCINELKAPYYMHEFVKKTIEIAMDGDEKRLEYAIRLLQEAEQEEIVTHHQLVLGFKRLQKALPELVLDVPHAEEIVLRVMKEMKEKLLSPQDL